MTWRWRANKTKSPKMPAQNNEKNSRIYMRPQLLILMRHRAFLTAHAAVDPLTLPIAPLSTGKRIKALSPALLKLTL